MVTADKKRGIRQYFWAEDNKTLLYQQDNDGDENFHVFGVDLASGNVRDFTPFQGVRAGVADLNRDFPDEVLVEANIREPPAHGRAPPEPEDRRPDARHREPGRRRGLGIGREVPGARGAGRDAGRRHRDPRARRRQGPLEDAPQGRSGRDPRLRGLLARRQVRASSRAPSAATRRASSSAISPRAPRRCSPSRPTSTRAPSSSIRRRTSCRPCPSPRAAPRGKSSIRPFRPTSTRSPSSTRAISRS